LPSTEAAEAAHDRAEGWDLDITDQVGELVCCPAIDIAEKPEGNVHVLRLDPTSTIQGRAHKSQVPAHGQRQLDAAK
jgi:hypothetical protein